MYLIILTIFYENKNNITNFNDQNEYYFNMIEKIQVTDIQYYLYMDNIRPISLTSIQKN